jgi:hypothetical protein
MTIIGQWREACCRLKIREPVHSKKCRKNILARVELKVIWLFAASDLQQALYGYEYVSLFFSEAVETGFL